MRRSRRGGGHGMEFGGSGEDSFVAVVVTKLTGALLFILLLTMVIMALMPKAIDAPGARQPRGGRSAPALAIATPETLPEAIAGRPYTLALAATGGRGPCNGRSMAHARGPGLRPRLGPAPRHTQGRDAEARSTWSSASATGPSRGRGRPTWSSISPIAPHTPVAMEARLAAVPWRPGWSKDSGS